METQSVNLRDITALKEEIKRAIGEGSREIVLDGYILEDIDDLSELNLDEFEKVKFRNCSFNFEEREFFVSSIPLFTLEFYNCNFEGAKIQFLDLENVKFENCTFDVDDTVSFREITALYAKDTSIKCRCLEIDTTYFNGIKIRLDEVYKVSVRYPNEEINISFESDIDSSNGINGEIQATTSTIKFIFDETTIDHGFFIINLSRSSFKFSEIHMKGKDILPEKNTIKNFHFKIYGKSNHPLFLLLSYVIFKNHFEIELVDNPLVYVSFIKCRFENPKEVELINIDLSRITFIGRNEALKEFYLKNPSLSKGFILSEDILRNQRPYLLVSLLTSEYKISLSHKDVLEEYCYLIENESLKNRREHEMIYILKRRKEFIEAKYEDSKVLKYLWYYPRYLRYSKPILISAILVFITYSLILMLQWIGPLLGKPDLKLLSKLPPVISHSLKAVWIISFLLISEWIKEKREIKIPKLHSVN